MSYLDHIAACNAHDLNNFVPFTASGRRVGWIKTGFADVLTDYPDVFLVGEDGVGLVPELDDYTETTRAVDGALRDMAARDLIPHWRDEPYPVGPSFAGPHLFEMERAAVPFFGVRAYGVHINGFVRDGADIHMWIGRRAEDRPVCPGELDNMIAGGQPVGIELLENVVKEAEEEAAVPEALARTARSVGAISYCQETETGLKPDTMFCYDLEVPSDFTPENHDGEIAEFFLWPVEKVMETVDRTFDFKFNCNLVNMDFFVRQGCLPPDHPDYVEIVRGLHR